MLLFYQIDVQMATAASATRGFELSNNAPTDGISAVEFSPDDPSLLLVGSWDKAGDLLLKFLERVN